MFTQVSSYTRTPDSFSNLDSSQNRSESLSDYKFPEKLCFISSIGNSKHSERNFLHDILLPNFEDNLVPIASPDEVTVDAQKSVSFPKDDLLSSLLTNSDESAPGDVFSSDWDFNSLICDVDQSKTSSFDHIARPSSEHKADFLSQVGGYGIGVPGAVSLSALAENHFLTNNITNRKSSESSDNGLSLADYFKTASFEQEPSIHDSMRKNCAVQEISLFDLSLEARDDVSKNNSVPEVNLEICIKPDIRSQDDELVKAELGGLISSIQQKNGFRSDHDVPSAKTLNSGVFSSDFKSRIADEQSPFAKNLFSIVQKTKTRVKRSLFAKALTCKTKPDKVLSEKVAQIEREMVQNFNQSFNAPIETNGSVGKHKKLENDTINSSEQSIFQTKNCMRVYPLGQICE